MLTLRLKKEIQNSFKDEITTKKKTSDRVNKILSESDQEHEIKKSSASSIAYNDLIGAYELYDKNSDTYVSPLQKRHQRQIRYIIFSSIILLVLLAATIIVGVIAFGG